MLFVKATCLSLCDVAFKDIQESQWSVCKVIAWSSLLSDDDLLHMCQETALAYNYRQSGGIFALTLNVLIISFIEF